MKANFQMKDLEREADRWWRQALSDFDFLPIARKAHKYDTCCFLAQLLIFCDNPTTENESGS